MSKSPTNRIEADVTFRKLLFVVPRWKIRARNTHSEQFIRGNNIHLRVGSGPHEIVFHFDPGGNDRRWQNTDQIWVQRGRCPEDRSTDPQIGVTAFDPAARTLTIWDEPTQRGEFHYSLNFERSNGQPKRWDPIIIHD